MRTLKIALLHMNVLHKQPDANRGHLIALAHQAAEEGVGIVVAPELSISGYAFISREDILPHVETETGPTLTALAEVTRKTGCYVCIGLAEMDAATGILYNSAIVLGPDGKRACRYRKINAESRWACPGDPCSDNTFETPWGRVGVLICSDSYHGLMPRVTALRGADLLLVPANWPPSGIDPRELWRARALENGFHLAACNRTGIDLSMDCRQAPSCGFDTQGNTLLNGQDSDSRIFWMDIPLGPDGRLEGRFREKRLSMRRTDFYHDAYLNLLQIRDLTGFLNLPEPGSLDMACLTRQGDANPMDALSHQTQTTPLAAGSLVVLPLAAYSDRSLENIMKNAVSKAVGVVTARPEGDGARYFFFDAAGDIRQWHFPAWPFDNGTVFPKWDFGPARVMLSHLDALAHPELALAAAKNGCDVAICCEKRLSSDDRLLAGARTIENIAVCVCAENDAGIWWPPQGHDRWTEFTVTSQTGCRCTLDTHLTRNKRFQDRVDFKTLLKPVFFP